VRLHGVKDYLDMLLMLEKFPAIHQTFNLVPSLIEQVEDYTNHRVKDKFLELSYKAASNLTPDEKEFILNSFFMINKEKVISFSPRYYELYSKREMKKTFTHADYIDLQVWFNLSWIDPYFRNTVPALKKITEKARFFTEEEKHIVLDTQISLLSDIIPAYKKFMKSNQVEVILSPYYHPILPLLYNTNIAKEANKKTILPGRQFAFPQDAKRQIDEAIAFFKTRFSSTVSGMWPSEQAVSEHILPFIAQAKVNWIVADEAILYKSLKKKKRDTRLLYQPHVLKTAEGDLNIVFRDRNLSDLIGFSYHSWETKSAVDDFLKHLKNTADAFVNQDILVTIAMDGENAWEYYPNDGHDFLELLYKRLSEADFLKTVTISEYLKMHPARHEIKRLSAGSWIYGEFGKWIGNYHKAKAWEYLAEARHKLQELIDQGEQISDLAWKQMCICEGSDWFWWYGEGGADFDELFRMHLANFYKLIGREIPNYLTKPI
ncbi:MAG: glycoside hydrolase family 57 protein, partial [Candidatus Omnitrophota bacterium]